MAIGLVGKKLGMTRIFTKLGAAFPATVIHIEINTVTQIKTLDRDGYKAIQVTTGNRRASLVNKSLSGHFKKVGIGPGRGLWEFINPHEDLIKAGDSLFLDRFSVGQRIDITGRSKGKGFQGGIKRWNFHMQDATHGNSLSHRAIGSTGQCQTPGRVWKGKKMAGHMGDDRVTVLSLEIIRVDLDHGVLLVKGSVPGATGWDVLVRPAIKKKIIGTSRI